MIIKTLYKYDRGGGQITVSPEKPEDKEYTEMYRLIADEGKILVNGEIETPGVDTHTTDGWEEKDAPLEDEPPTLAEYPTE